MVCKLEVCHSYVLFHSRLNEVVTQKQSLKVWELIHFILWTEDKDNPQYSMPLSRYQEVHEANISPLWGIEVVHV